MLSSVGNTAFSHDFPGIPVRGIVSPVDSCQHQSQVLDESECFGYKSLGFDVALVISDWTISSQVVACYRLETAKDFDWLAAACVPSFYWLTGVNNFGLLPSLACILNSCWLNEGHIVGLLPSLALGDSDWLAGCEALGDWSADMDGC